MAEVKFESHLAVIQKATDEQLARAAEIIGGMAESYAKKNITQQGAVDTGNLRNSITHTTENNGHTVVIGSAVTYAPYVELGTGKMKPRPYLRPAIEDHKQAYRDVVEQELKR